ncbi:MAG: GAF domain-containing sensor histidine kinase [Planctomycetes bacterium]|nr:GAF domain-containing sensor histidine kinase [Planctomycetota bacterium]
MQAAHGNKSGAPALASLRPEGSDRPVRRGLDALAQVCQMVAGDLDVETVMRSAMRAAETAMNAEACTIFLREPDPPHLSFHIVDGPQTDGLARTALPIDDRSIAGWVAAHQQPLLVPDAYGDARFNREYDARTGFRTRSIICVPLAAKGRPLGVLQVLNRRDGRPFDADDLELAQAVAGLIAVAIHNAEEHQARVAAERLATVGQTMAGMAHCIKNILNGLQAGSYILDQSLQSAPESGVARGWEMVKRNMGLLSNIVLDMLSYSRPRKPLCRPCQVAEICQGVAALLQPQAAARGVALVTSGETAEVCVDEAGIKRCLLNLVGNAIDACGPSGGLVEIEAGPAGADGRFAIRVRDNGCGIDPAAQGKIFAPFFSTKGNKGTGLGLPVTKKIVEEHGGAIQVRSARGEGTEFTIVLPVRPEAEASG